MPNRAVHPRARSIFKARTKKPNFVLSVAATTIRLSFVLALCVALALLGAVVGIAKAFVDTAPTLDLAALDAFFSAQQQPCVITIQRKGKTLDINLPAP